MGMKLENQVCSLEHAKKLKELGVKQESLWWWGITKKDKAFVLWDTFHKNQFYREEDYFVYSAFTVAELGEMLPPLVKIEEAPSLNKYFLMHYDIRKSETIISLKNYTSGVYLLFKCDTEANARAKMLIWLIENKKHDV